jgi:hypothetical protein
MVSTMKILRNEKGMALLMSLMLTMIALAITMALFYMITWHTKLSAAHKQYKTAIEASHGGVEIFAKQIIPQVFANMTGASLTAQFPGINLVPSSGNCLLTKLTTPTSGWGSACGTDTAPFDPTKKSDVTLTLQGKQSSYKVYTKIVDTVPGNSDTSGYDLLDSGSGVAGMSPGVSPKHMPAKYRIEVQGQTAVNPKEKAKLSVLYAY